MSNSVEDLKTLRNWVLGIISFATAVSAILVQALHFAPEPTIISVTGFACMMLLIVFLINKSEKRQSDALEEYRKENETMLNGFKDDLDYLKDMALENQRSAVRSELYTQIRFNPKNHDTIIKIGERYFGKKEKGGLEGDWYMSTVFLEWAKEEKVELPPSFRSLIQEQ